MKSPINSRKHVVQHTQYAIASGATLAFSDCIGNAVQDVNNANEVIEGAVVKAIFVEHWILAGASSAGSFVAIVEKAPSGVGQPSFTNMTTLDAYPNKKNILLTTQGLVGTQDTNPIPIFRQWIKIPKGKQRIGLDDKIRIIIAAIGTEALAGCGLSVFKSYN